MSYIDFVGGNNYLAVNRNLLKNLGPVETIFYSELVDEFRYWEREDKLDEEDMFFSTVENIEERTGIGRNQQTSALKSLQEKGLIIVKKKGLPAKRYIKLILDDTILKRYFESNADTFEESDNKARKIQKAENQLTGQLKNSSLVDSKLVDQSTENQSVSILNKQPNITNLKQQPPLLGSCCLEQKIKTKEVHSILQLYCIRIGKPETLQILSEYSEEQIHKIGRVLQEKSKKGIIVNPTGLLAVNTNEICKAILENRFYPDITKNNVQKQQQPGDDYDIYLPPLTQ